MPWLNRFFRPLMPWPWLLFGMVMSFVYCVGLLDVKAPWQPWFEQLWLSEYRQARAAALARAPEFARGLPPQVVDGLLYAVKSGVLMIAAFPRTAGGLERLLFGGFALLAPPIALGMAQRIATVAHQDPDIREVAALYYHSSVLTFLYGVVLALCCVDWSAVFGAA